MIKGGAEALCGSHRGARDRSLGRFRVNVSSRDLLVEVETEEEVEAGTRSMDAGDAEAVVPRRHLDPASFL